jgi:hypothetical protein
MLLHANTGLAYGWNTRTPPPQCMNEAISQTSQSSNFDIGVSLLMQIFRQEIENRRAAIQHQQQAYGEGQDADGSEEEQIANESGAD